MLPKLTVFLVLLSMPILAQENKIPAGYDPVQDNISEKYEAGQFLIYNCVDKHWVCVLDSHFNECEKARIEDIENKVTDLRCAPIGSFPTKKSCFQQQLFMVSQNFATRFCLHPAMKEKELKF